MIKLLILSGLVLLVGCEQSENFTGPVAVQAAMVDNTNIVTPKGTCTNCNGTGRIKTGDGISTTECDECDGTGYSSFIEDFEPEVFESKALPMLPYEPEMNCSGGSCSVAPTKRFRLFRRRR